MKATLKIEMDNAAFQDSDVNAELSRILRDLADTIDERTISKGIEIGLYDLNGNRVGEIKFR